MASMLHISMCGIPGLFHKTAPSTTPDPDPTPTGPPASMADAMAWYEFTEASGSRKDSQVTPNYQLRSRNSSGHPTSSTDSLLGDASVGGFNTGDRNLWNNDNKSEFRFPADVMYHAVWFKPTSDTTTGTRFISGIFRTSNNRRTWAITVDQSSGLVTFRASNNGTSAGQSRIDLPGVLNNNQWNLIEVYFDNGEMGLAVNGAAWTTITATFTELRASTSGNVFMVGARHEGGSVTTSPTTINNSQIVGLLDQMVFYRRVLTDTERAALYNSGDGILYTDIPNA